MTAAALLDELRGLGIELQPHGDRLRFRPQSVVTDELLARLQAHKSELLEMLRGGYGYPIAAISDNRHGSVAGETLDIIDIPDPCPDCGGIEVWQDLAGGWNCATCSPRTAGPRLRDLAQRLRERYPVTRDADLPPRRPAVPRTWPPVVPDSILAAPVPTCSDCGRPRSVVPGQPGRPLGLCSLCWTKRR